jgi:hypothetical protein
MMRHARSLGCRPASYEPRAHGERTSYERADAALTAWSRHTAFVNFVAIEDLAVANMVRNGKLSRVISDAGWAEFRFQLDYVYLRSRSVRGEPAS